MKTLITHKKEGIMDSIKEKAFGFTSDFNRVNGKRSHAIYFSCKINGKSRQLTLQGDKQDCIAKANAWLQWEVSPFITIQGEWEETDYLTFNFREAK
tara:strand:- start:132 stop:422 length:291 start_codon:yes stop_codon:yes gene_type:complete